MTHAAVKFRVVAACLATAAATASILTFAAPVIYKQPISPETFDTIADVGKDCFMEAQREVENTALYSPNLYLDESMDAKAKQLRLECQRGRYPTLAWR